MKDAAGLSLQMNLYSGVSVPKTGRPVNCLSLGYSQAQYVPLLASL